MLNRCGDKGVSAGEERKKIPETFAGSEMSPGLIFEGKARSDRPFHLFQFEAFDDITDFDIVEVLYVETALVP